jgi:hypothetical protein
LLLNEYSEGSAIPGDRKPWEHGPHYTNVEAETATQSMAFLAAGYTHATDRTYLFDIIKIQKM